MPKSCAVAKALKAKPGESHFRWTTYICMYVSDKGTVTFYIKAPNNITGVCVWTRYDHTGSIPMYMHGILYLGMLIVPKEAFHTKYIWLEEWEACKRIKSLLVIILKILHSVNPICQNGMNKIYINSRLIVGTKTDLKSQKYTPLTIASLNKLREQAVLFIPSPT